MYILLACIDCWKLYNRLVFAFTDKTAIKVKSQCVSSSNFVNHRRFFACAASNLTNLEFKTTIIKDTNLTLAVIPFKVEANNSLIFCHYKHMRKKFEFPFLFIFITPWCLYVTAWSYPLILASLNICLCYSLRVHY